MGQLSMRPCFSVPPPPPNFYFGQLWDSVPARLIIVIRTWSSFQLLFGAVKGLAVAVTYMLALLAPCPSGLSLLINFLFLKGYVFPH